MKRSLLIMAIMLIAAPFFCSAIVVAINDDVHFDYQFIVANDFHVQGVIKSAAPPVLQDILIFGDPATGNWMVSGFTITPMGNHEWAFTADFVTDGIIQFCQWIHFGIFFDVEGYNIIVNLKGFWTFNGIPIVIPPTMEPAAVPLTGFEVAPSGPGTQVLRIMNDSGVNIQFRNLEVAVSNNAIPLEDMFSTGLGRPGEVSATNPALQWQSAAGTIPAVIAPTQTVAIPLEDMFITLQPGQFLLMRGQQLMDGAPDGDWGFFWEQHGE